MKQLFSLLLISLLSSGSISAQSKDEMAVAAAVETLRKAMVDGDRTTLENIADKGNEWLKQDFFQSFDVEPQGGQRYKLTLVKTIAEAREYSKIINLD